MKYVALKDGTIFSFKDNANYMKYQNIKCDFLKEADTIEELCDEYIVKYRHLYYRNYSLEKAIQKRDWLCKNNFVVLGEKPDIYGAIWTNKGLVYVAKLNEKGELELL